MPAAVFFAVQVLEQFRDLEDQILIQQFEKLSLIPFVITPGECPSLVHYGMGFISPLFHSCVEFREQIGKSDQI